MMCWRPRRQARSLSGFSRTEDISYVPTARLDSTRYPTVFPLFTRPTWAHLQVLLTGTLLGQGPRTVAARDGLGVRICYAFYCGRGIERVWNGEAKRKIPQALY